MEVGLLKLVGLEALIALLLLPRCEDAADLRTHAVQALGVDPDRTKLFEPVGAGVGRHMLSFAKPESTTVHHKLLETLNDHH